MKILGRTRHLADSKSEVNALRQHLVVENKIIGIFQQRQLGEHLAAESAVAGVILGKLCTEKQILEGSQQTISHVLIKRHAAAQRLSSDNAGAQHDIDRKSVV